MSNSISDDLAFEIATELGPDIDYVRPKQQTDESRLYMTGVEVAVVIGTAVRVGFLKGVVTELLETIGKELGKVATERVVSRLAQLWTRARSIDLENVPEMKAQLTTLHLDLDTTIRDELAPSLRSIYLEHEAKAAAAGHLEIRVTLQDFGVPPEKSSEHADEIANMLQIRVGQILRWTKAISVGGSDRSAEHCGSGGI